MTSTPTFARSQRARALGAAFAVAMLLGGTAACSSDSDSKSGDKSSSGSNTKSDSSEAASEAGSDQGLPEGFPDDIPMPAFEKANVIKSATDATPDIWVLMLTIDPTLEVTGESLIAAYSAQLEDAGYEVGDNGAGGAEAKNDKWMIDFHSSMDGTMTVGTYPN